MKGLALHILGDDLSLLSRQRDVSKNGLVIYAGKHPGLSFRAVLDGSPDDHDTPSDRDNHDAPDSPDVTELRAEELTEETNVGRPRLLAGSPPPRVCVRSARGVEGLPRSGGLRVGVVGCGFADEVLDEVV